MAESELNTFYHLVCGGDREAEKKLFDGLRERFGLILQQKVGNEQDAEELIQESLMVIAQKYRAIEIRTSFTAWAYQVLENKLLYYYRTKKSRRDRFVSITDGIADGESSPSDPTLKYRLLTCLKKINAVNPRFARLLNLHHQGYTVEDLCVRFGITANGVYTILSRARAMLKVCLEKGQLA